MLYDLWVFIQTTSNFYYVCNLFVVDLREVKEIRVGKNSKDFERWPDDSKRYDSNRCFIVFFGMEFRLRTLSIAGKVNSKRKVRKVLK